MDVKQQVRCLSMLPNLHVKFNLMKEDSAFVSTIFKSYDTGTQYLPG